VDDARQAPAVVAPQSRRVCGHLPDASGQRVWERRDGAFVHCAPQRAPAAPIPAQVLPVLARVADLLEHAHAGEIQKRAQLVVAHPREVAARLGDGVLGFGWERPFRDAHMGKAVLGGGLFAIQGTEQPRPGAPQRPRIHAVAHPRDGLRGASANGHDFNAGGVAPGAAGNQHGGAEAGEGIQHRTFAQTQRVPRQGRRKPFLVLEPAQARLRLVRLIGDETAVEVAAHDQAAGEAPAQGGARGSVAACRHPAFAANGECGFLRAAIAGAAPPLTALDNTHLG